MAAMAEKAVADMAVEDPAEVSAADPSEVSVEASAADSAADSEESEVEDSAVDSAAVESDSDVDSPNFLLEFKEPKDVHFCRVTNFCKVSILKAINNETVISKTKSPLQRLTSPRVLNHRTLLINQSVMSHNSLMASIYEQ